MDEFAVPILHEWYHQNSIISTPDNGLLYSSRFDLCYIPPLASGEQMPKVKIINPVRFFPSGRTIKSLACAPDWQKERTFAVLDSANIVCVYDLDREEPIKGHRAHVASLNHKKGKDTDQHKAITSALCFSTNGKLLSCDHSTLVIYCLLSDRYKIYGNLFDKKSVVVVLTRVPNDPSVYVAGMQNGLIQIFTIKKPSILHSLRRHDHEIVSIDLLAVPVLREEKPRIAFDRTDHQVATADDKKRRPKKKAHKKAKTSTADTSDFLDIYNFDDNQDEFGAGIDRDTKDLKQDKFRDKNKTMEGFNFLEACQNLKEDILKAATRRNQDESEDDDEGEEDHTPEFNTDDENELDDCEQQRDCGRVSGDDGDKDEDELSDDAEDNNYERKLIIVSGSREQNIFFWEYETGLPLGKVVVQADTPKRLCNTIFTNAVWLDERHIVANTASGSVVEWKVEAYRKNNLVNLRTVLNPQPYPVDKIFHVIRANTSDGRYVWCSSINRKLICLRVVENEAPTVALDYSCIVPKNRCLVENPIESMVIAVASNAPRIAVTNLMNLQPDCIPIKHFSNNIGNIVTALAWHPEEEERLAFGTCEGRIGILNTESVTNGPILLNAFINKDVYALCWGYLTDEKNQRQLALFASGKTELAYYYLSGPGKFKPIVCKQFGKVSNVNIAGKLCFIGTQEGEAFVTDLDHNMAILFRGHVTTPMRYITSLEYKGDMLAVGASCLKISLVDFSKGFHGCGEKNITTLEGHEDTICQLRWSRGDTMRLVSASFDKTVRVWDAPSSTCLKVYNTGSFAYSAMFSPLDENIIIYVTAWSSLACFDYTKDHPRQSKVKIETSASKKSKNSAAPKIQIPWACSEDVEPVKPKTFEDTKAPTSATASDGTGTGNPEEIAKTTNDAIDDLADKVQQVTLKGKKARHLPVKEITTFSLAYREANKPKETLECIVKMLHTVEPPPTDPLESNQNGDSEIEDSDIENENDVKKESVEEPSIEKVSTTNSQVEDGPVYYNEKLFSTEEKLKQLIEEEVQHSMASKKYSVGFVMLPHLLHKLKDTILERIAKKDLTTDLLALAPYISHIFWRQCCQAYGYQLIENGNSLASVPYFLASHNVDDAIETLRDGKYYREAWAICRLQKMPDDPINEKLATDWAEHLESVGNLEAAALVWTGVKKYENATKALLKRKELTKDILRTIDELHVKIQEAKPTKEK